MRKLTTKQTEPLARSVPQSLLAVRPYVPGKPIEEVQRELGVEQVRKLASNENALGASPRAIEAIEAATRQVHLYPDGGCFYLKRDLTTHLEVPADNLIIGNGSDEIISLLARVFVREGDKVVVGAPSFLMYAIDTQLSQGELACVPLQDFRYDVDALIDALDESTKLVYVCNPNNPTGTIIERADFERLVDAATARDILVVSDEAYSEYVENPRYPDSLGLVKQGANVIILRTFSKIYGLAGLRIGYGVARAGIIAILNRARPPFNVNRLAQAAARASLLDSGHVRASRALAREGKQYLYQELEALKVPYVPSETNFILMQTGAATEHVIEHLLERGIIVRGMKAYQLPTHIRVTVGTQEDNEAFVRELRDALG